MKTHMLMSFDKISSDMIIPANSSSREGIPISIYIHIPFCLSRCSYCDFLSFASCEHLIPQYVDALIKEIRAYRFSLREKLPVHTIYFGGGTPSLLSFQHLSLIIESLYDTFEIQPSLEITLEANPNSFHFDTELIKLGVNRLSIGVQSVHETELATLGRKHSFNDVQTLINTIKPKGYQNINIDLIYGIPLQTNDSWQSTLEKIITLEPEHLSLYSLTIEKDTLLSQKIISGELHALDEDLAAEMYEFSRNYLRDKGYLHYEISNWAKKGKNNETYFCRHNLQYWLNLPYIGFGAGAHGFINYKRLKNTENLYAYIKLCDNDAPPSFPFSLATEEVVELSKIDEMNETIFMGLRLIERGILCEEFFDRFGTSLEQQYGKSIEKLVALNLLEWYNKNNQRGLRLTSKGCLLANQVFIYFI